MTDNSNEPSTTSLEAPASWNTRYTTPPGFVCQITLRADIEIPDPRTHPSTTGGIYLTCSTFVVHSL